MSEEQQREERISVNLEIRVFDQVKRLYPCSSSPPKFFSSKIALGHYHPSTITLQEDLDKICPTHSSMWR